MNKASSRLRLYHYWRSTCSWRVRWAMAIKEVPCEFVAIDLLSDVPESPEYIQRNPQGYVPVLEFLEPGTPFRYLGESFALIEWLEETYPTPPLLPKDSFLRAR